MSHDKPIEYTESAAKRLKQFEASIHNRIEQELRDRKRVPGDEKIEITASDIEDLDRAMFIRFRDRYEYRTFSRDLLVRVYAVVGLITATAGIFYPMLSSLRDNPTQAMLIIVGVTMSTASFLLYSLLNRRRQLEELEKLEDRSQRLRARVMREHTSDFDDEFRSRVLEELESKLVREIVERQITKP